METKFKADPYNSSNFLIQENDILNIMNSLNIQDFKINNLSFYQQSFVHKSYTELKDYEDKIIRNTISLGDSYDY